MSAAEIAFKFLKRAIRSNLGMSQFAALAYLAAHGESDRASIMYALQLTPGTNTAHSLLGKLHARGFITQRLEPKGCNGKFYHDITPTGLQVLGLCNQRKGGSAPC